MHTECRPQIVTKVSDKQKLTVSRHHTLALNVKVEMSEYKVPYGRVADLPRFLNRLLDSYDEQNLLTWREGSTPEDEI